MKIASKLYDGRINAANYLMELSIGDYLSLAREVVKSNEFQRKRVSNSKTVYSLLKSDIVQGCVIPPIVLALSAQSPELTDENVKSVLLERIDSLMILDGLQRTHSFIDLEDSFIKSGDDEGLLRYRRLPIRCEIYIGINRLGILYRMLTLNTGQTPMSLRQQIEMLYLDYAKEEVDGVILAKEADGRKAASINTYNFKEVIEGFNCYLERNELPLERADLLENIKSLEKLAQENSSQDLFREYVQAFHRFVTKLIELTSDAQLDEVDFPDGGNWGKSAKSIFKKQQALAGFGAAAGKLKDSGDVAGFSDITAAISRLEFDDEDVQDFLLDFNKAMKWIAENAKKIGNGQRMYFQYYFRELLNPTGDGYLKLSPSIDLALQKYKSQVF